MVDLATCVARQAILLQHMSALHPQQNHFKAKQRQPGTSAGQVPVIGTALPPSSSQGTAGIAPGLAEPLRGQATPSEEQLSGKERFCW